MRGSNIIRHISESLAHKLAVLMRDTVLKVVAKITGENRAALEDMWTQGWEIRILCKYKLHGFKKNNNLILKTFIKKCFIYSIKKYHLGDSKNIWLYQGGRPEKWKVRYMREVVRGNVWYYIFQKIKTTNIQYWSYTHFETSASYHSSEL